MKFQCPYMEKGIICTHKHIDARNSKHRRRCGYKNPEYCQMYNEWLKLKKSCERASMDELGLFKNKGEDND